MIIKICDCCLKEVNSFEMTLTPVIGDEVYHVCEKCRKEPELIVKLLQNSVKQKRANEAPEEILTCRKLL